ncbi:MAG: right-handed parallel beta-helix repeat-containing protein [Candidatus Cloacimonetes bacterium]|nr:right-handed parallel beta-helix repeat-containing protein [Candidatus Cloacimonadota bacterium]
MKTIKVIILGWLLTFLPIVANTTIIHVPDDQPTIQEGINAAVDGDTVIVSNGIYIGIGNRDIDFSGRAIVVMSENAPDSCIIDCENIARGFYFHSNEGPSSILSGFRIINGFSSMYWQVSGGAGILCTENSSPTIKNCVFIGSSADENGGGICCYYNSNPTIENCTFDTNSAYYGGGIYCCETSPTIVNCNFNGNSAGENGGGICCFYGSVPLIESCTFSGNSAMFGGGIKCWNNSSPTIKNCTLSGNWADEYGGGIDCAYWCNPTIEYCTISGNSSELGGGISCTNECNPAIANCTISENTANYNGGGIYSYENSSPSLSNSILWNNTPQEIYVYSSSVTATYSDIQGGWTGTGNIDADPLFVNPEDGDFHLTWANFPIQDSTMSPCIDAGDPNSPLDPDSTRADMGAYYFDQNQQGIEQTPSLPARCLLYQNYPNPFCTSTIISFLATDLHRLSPLDSTHLTGQAQIKIYNVKGQLVKQLSIPNSIGNNNQSSIEWDGKDENGKPVSSDIYFYRLIVDDKVIDTKKCLLLK